ncbi:DHH family phosphoesterase [Neobacillus sp. D3-1R]|uniref:DHH family phosphoesterase n=1 Tax=Neobacillus sp. D3-1R TaxID=3445778 RepID=UPI003FA011A6
MYHLFTHNDLDGVGCGILAKLAFGEQVNVRYNSISSLDHQVGQYIEKYNEQQNSDYLIITDLSTNEEIAQKLNEMVSKGAKVLLIDHHKTALHFNDYSWGMVKVEYEHGKLASATSLLYDYLKQHQFIEETKSVSEFVELVRQYDTWEWDVNNNQKAKRLNDLFYMVSIDEFEEKMVMRLQEQEHFGFDEFEQKLLDMEEEKIERYIRKKKRELIQTFINDQCVGIVHAESYHSELGNELGKENSHIDYIAILNMGAKKISYRTVHDHIDVSRVAEQYGGGGHAKASGSTMNKEAYSLFVEKVFPLESVRMDAFKNKFNIKGSPKGVLYDNRGGERFFISQLENGSWQVETDRHGTVNTFKSFAEAEYDIKRNHTASLVRDELFIDYLLEVKQRSKC